MITGESVKFQIEVEDQPKKSILLVFDRKSEFVFVPWQDALNLVELMEKVVKDVQDEFSPIVDVEAFRIEHEQVRLNHHNGLVALIVEWTDRVRFTSLLAFKALISAMKIMIQDCQLEARGVHIQYNKEGLIEKIHNSRSGITQHVR